MTELEILERAQMYINKMANGINPITDEQVNDDDTLNNVRVSRCLFYVSNVLDNVIKSKSKPSKSKKEIFSITSEDLEKYQYSEYPVYISEITSQLNSINSNKNTKRLSAACINRWISSIGLIEEQTDNNGRTIKVPTESGIQKGIIQEQRISVNGTPYISLSYNNNMQKFIIENIQEIINKEIEYKNNRRLTLMQAHEGQENAGLPWTTEQEDMMVKMYKENKSIHEIANNMKRTPNGINARLKKLGLIA